jgi:hypothetical protein
MIATQDAAIQQIERLPDAGLALAWLLSVRQGLAALSTPAPVYPNSDRGLREMCPGVPVATLRGIQEAAFRAGRESIAAPVAAPPADLVAKREEVECPECHETCSWCSWYRKNAREAGCGSGGRKCAWGEQARGVPCKTCDGRNIRD